MTNKIESAKIDHANAYKRWSTADDTVTRRSIHAMVHTVGQLASQFCRKNLQPQLRTRLAKLGLVESKIHRQNRKNLSRNWPQIMTVES